MLRKDYLYRIKSYLCHSFTARHSRGGGIHSPYLFEWVRFVARDTHRFYVWDEIEQLRNQLLHDSTEIVFTDLGVGKGRQTHRKISDIARSSLASPRYAQLLFRLINWLTIKKHETANDAQNSGLQIVELGTSLGITTSYLAACDSNNHVVTFDGCPSVVSKAKEIWSRLGLQNIESVVGDIDDTLFIYTPAREIDVAFIDANHTCEATYRYFHFLVEHMHVKGVIVVDDIHYSNEMQTAWKKICAHPRVTCTMDFYQMGLVFFDPHYLRAHYRLRLPI